jgi:hypothetical protein
MRQALGLPVPFSFQPILDTEMDELKGRPSVLALITLRCAATQVNRPKTCTRVLVAIRRHKRSTRAARPLSDLMRTSKTAL